LNISLTSVYLVNETGPWIFLDIILKYISSRWSIHPSFIMWLRGARHIRQYTHYCHFFSLSPSLSL